MPSGYVRFSPVRSRNLCSQPPVRPPCYPFNSTQIDRVTASFRLKETNRGLAIDQQAVTELELFDAKFVVHSNDGTLTAKDMVLGYQQQQRVEEARRTMKSGLKMRPVFHWAPQAMSFFVPPGLGSRASSA